MSKAESDARAQRQKEAMERAALRLRAKANEITRRFERRTFTAAEVFPEVDEAWKKASEMHTVAHQLRNISREHLKEADYNVIRLLELRAQLKREIGSPTKHAPGSEVWRKARDYQIAPILWVVRVSRPVLERHIAIDKAVGTVADIPRKIVNAPRQIASEALGLPKWFIPAVAGALVVAIGARFYQTVSATLPGRP